MATLCEETVLKTLPNFNSFASKTLGRGYIVPECDVKKVLEELDFREKGGYTRRVVDVEKLDGTGTMKVRFIHIHMPTLLICDEFNC